MGQYNPMDKTVDGIPVSELRMKPDFSKVPNDINEAMKDINGMHPNQLGIWDPYNEIIQELLKLHAAKKSDYAQAANQFSNFEASARYAGVTVLQSFDILIGTKIARLQNLKESGNNAKNESIEDTEIDLANYIIIKKAYKLWRSRMDSQVRKSNPPPTNLARAAYQP